MKKISKKTAVLIVLAATIVLIMGCQRIFTSSLLSFLQRDPANLSLDQQMLWAENALASGDPALIKQAYDALAASALGAPANGELGYIAANLALELSGVPDFLSQVIDGSIASITVGSLETFLAASVTASYLVNASIFYQNVNSNDPSLLSSTDYILGTLCILLDLAEREGGGFIAGIVDATPASNFVADGIASAESGSDAEGYLMDLDTAIP